MTARRRARPGIRRDGQVRRICSNPVPRRTIDGTAERPDAPGDAPRVTSLRPALDAGLAIEGRLARERRQRERRRATRKRTLIAAVVALSVLALGWRYTSDRTVEQMPLDSLAAARADSAPTPSRAGAADSAIPQLRAIEPGYAPTPIFASHKSITLRLPVLVEDLTEVGFHQASYAYALRLKTPLEKADMKIAKKKRGTGRDISTQSDDPDAKLVGSALYMWRSRPGSPDTAVDVGAPPGSVVLAPLSGTVVKVKRYKLYGQHDDYELHIQPAGHPDIDCVIIHIDDLTVKPGDPVTAGVTRIGVVRKLSDRVNHQLGDYTRGGGDHIHVQLNNARHPDYKGLKGALSVSGS